MVNWGSIRGNLLEAKQPEIGPVDVKLGEILARGWGAGLLQDVIRELVPDHKTYQFGVFCQ